MNWGIFAKPFQRVAAGLRSQQSETAALGPEFRPFKIAGYALAMLILVGVVVGFVQSARFPGDRDFISFWGAARLAIAGNPAAAYDNAALHAVQLTASPLAQGGLPFPYPPAFLLFVIPFGLLPFTAGMVAWACATFSLYFAAVKRMFPDSGWLPPAFPPVFVAAVIGQNSFLMAALLVGGLMLLNSRPFVAGLLLGCLILKPQMALLLPVAVLAARQWRTIFGAALSSTGLLLLGVAVFGLAATRAWIDQMPLYVDIARNGLVGWNKLASVYAGLRQAGVDAGLAMAVHATVAAVAAAAVWKIWRSDAGQGCKTAVLIAATMLASPYLFLYDSVVLAVPFLWLAKQRTDPLLLGILWCLPIATIAQLISFPGPVNLNALTPIALLVLICHQAWDANRKPAKIEASPALA